MSAATYPKFFQDVEKWSTEKFIEKVRKGIPSNYFDALQKTLGVQRNSLVHDLNLSDSTLQRRKGSKLKTPETEKVLNSVKVFNNALEVFEEWEHSKDWLTIKQDFLGDVSPISLCDTNADAPKVLHILGQIEYGIPTRQFPYSGL